MQGAIGLAGLCSGHAVFRCMSDGWPNTTSNGDSTHVRNTHDREPYLFTGQTERKAKLGNPIAASISDNETCVLSLMSGIWVNSGTASRRGIHGKLATCRAARPVNSVARFCPSDTPATASAARHADIPNTMRNPVPWATR